MRWMEDLILALRGAGEPTRLRILAVLARCELTVGELCRVLVQSQPRVSRHLRLLADAGLAERHAEGVNAYYRLARTGLAAELSSAVLALLDAADPVARLDLERLDEVKAERAEAAAVYFADIAGQWDEIRSFHVDEVEVEAALMGLVTNGDAEAGGTIGHLLDIGTGTGRMLELFADRITFGLGIDLSAQMLGVARSRLDEEALAHCVVRQADVYDLRSFLDPGSFDLAIVHQALHFLDDPARAIAEAAFALRPGGRLVVVDFASHDQVQLRAEYAHRWLGFSDEEMAAWCVAAGLDPPSVMELPPPAEGGTLTTTIWTSRRLSATTPQPTLANAASQETPA